jgi:hypothetical protein
MKQETMDSEVLRIIIDVLKAQTRDDEGDSRWQEDAQWYLNKIGEAFIDVSSWEYENDGLEKKQFEYGTSSKLMDNIIDEVLEREGFEKRDE